MAMKSIEFIVPSGQPTELFAEKVKETFSPYSVRDGKLFDRASSGHMSEIPVKIYEVAYAGSSLDPIYKFARISNEQLSGKLRVKLNGETIFPERDSLTDASVESVDWPEKFDIGIQTVIGTELHAAQDYFNVDPIQDALSIESQIYYKGTLDQNGRKLNVVISTQDAAGNEMSVITAERIISNWNPTTIFLMGICAGRRVKTRIGDVVTPRVIVDDTEGVMEAKERLKRPKIFAPPTPMVQQLKNFRFENAEAEWHELLKEKLEVPTPPAGKEAEFEEHVASLPFKHEAAIYSSNLLLRDGDYLEEQSLQIHQQIRIGEMEAAGFSAACNSRTTPTPWFVVRGVSDFGDTLKDDQFHKWAAYSAAAFLRVLIKHGINFSLFDSK